MSVGTREELEGKLKAYVGIATGPARVAPDAVNEAMIHHWCDAMGDRNPIYTDAEAAKKTVHGGLVAPPTAHCSSPRRPGRSTPTTASPPPRRACWRASPPSCPTPIGRS